MTFSEPFFLRFLWVALAPPVLLLVFAPKRKFVALPAFFLLRRVMGRLTPGNRLKKILIVAFRILALACLVLSFASPVAENRPRMSFLPGGAPSSGKKCVVFLVDSSYSMKKKTGGKTLFDLSKNLLERLLGILGENDKAFLVFFSGEPEEAARGSGRGFENLVKYARSREAGFSGTDYRGAFEKAFAVLSGEKADEKIIFLLGDLAAHGFSAGDFKPRDLPLYDPRVRIFASDFGSDERNFYVKAARWNPDAGKISAQVNNPSGSPGTVHVRARAGDFLAQKTVFFEKGEQKRAVEFVLGRGAPESGTIEISGDSLEADNVYYFTLASRRETKRLLLSCADPSHYRPGFGAYFLRKIFSGAGRYAPGRADLKSLGDGEISLYDGIILLGVGPGDAEKMKKYVSAGGFCLFVPSSSGDYGNVSHFYESFGISPESPEKGDFALVPSGRAPPNYAAGISDFELPRIRFGTVLKVLPGDAGVLWDFASGNARYPALVWKNLGKGKIAFFNSSLDASWSNIAMKPFFGTFVFSILDFLSQGPFQSEKEAVLVGEEFRLDGFSDYSGPVKISGPSGEREILPAGKSWFFTPLLPGNYRWESGDGFSGAFSANLPSASEGDLRASGKGFWKKLDYSTAAEEFTSSISEMRLWGLLAAAALVFAVASWILTEGL